MVTVATLAVIACVYSLTYTQHIHTHIRKAWQVKLLGQPTVERIAWFKPAQARLCVCVCPLKGSIPITGSEVWSQLHVGWLTVLSV